MTLPSIVRIPEGIKSLLAGSLVAGIIVYLVSAALQGFGIYHVAKKSGFKKGACATFVAITVIIPFGIEICLLIIAFAKKEKKDAESKV